MADETTAERALYYGTIVAVSPLTLRLDTTTPTLTVNYCYEQVSTLEVDDRVLVTTIDRRICIISKVGSVTDSGFLSADIGVIKLYGGATAPAGHLMCNGAAVSRTTYADLFAIIGTAFGVGDGSTTFNVPDMRGFVPVGKTAGGTFATLNNTGGAETHALTSGEMPSHTHTQDAHTHTQVSHNHVQDAHTHTQVSHNHLQDTHDHGPGSYTTNNGGNHTHTVGNGAFVSTGTTGTASVIPVTGGSFLTNAATNADGVHAHGVTGGTSGSTTATNQAATATNNNATATNQAATATNNNATATNQNTGGGGAHNNLQPYRVVNYIIRY